MKITEAKLSLFTDDFITHVEKVTKESRKELSKLINKLERSQDSNSIPFIFLYQNQKRN